MDISIKDFPYSFSQNHENDILSLYNLLIELYELLEDKESTKSCLKAINQRLYQIQKEENVKMFIKYSGSELLDILKCFTILIIPLNLAFFHFETSSTLIFEIRNVLFEFLLSFSEILKKDKNFDKNKDINYYMNKFEIRKYLLEQQEPIIDRSQEFITPANLLKIITDLHRILLGENTKDFLIFKKILTSLIIFKDKRSLENIIKIVFECILYKILHREEYIGRNYMDLPIIPESPRPPYLPYPLIIDKGKCTLVLDLDETLVHTFQFKKGGYYFLRPGALDLIKIASEFYEIVVFTAGTQIYADNILNAIDPKNIYIRHRLYCQHLSDNLRKKDLSKLGRKLKKVIIVDNNPANFQLNKENGLHIKTWNNDIDDHQLFGLINLLTNIAKIRFVNVRYAIDSIKKQLKYNDINKLDNPYDDFVCEEIVLEID